METAFTIVDGDIIVFDGDIQAFANYMGYSFSTPVITVKLVKNWCVINGFNMFLYGNA
jgi:hypothetical protein